MYRDAAKLIQQRLRSLRDRYKQLPSDKYYYAMAMLYTGVDAVKASNSANTEPFLGMMEDLEKEFDEALKD